MVEEYKQIIINRFLDRYEGSKCFKAQSPAKPNISMNPSRIFDFYHGDKDYAKFMAVNEAIRELEKEGLIRAEREPHKDVYARLYVDLNFRDELYSLVGRKPKNAVYDEISTVLDGFDGTYPILTAYCARQRENIDKRNKVDQFDGNMAEYRNVLIAVKEILALTEETPRRNFSANVFHDSKLFEKTLESKVKAILFTYGDSPDKDTVLEEYFLVKNPGHVYVKGGGRIQLRTQVWDLAHISGDIGLSTNLLKTDVETVVVTGKKGVITIENLTTFEDFKDSEYLAIYLGGFSNTLRRAFLKTIFEQNPNVPYNHWGDIDVGGFRILNHLREKTGIPFKPYNMDLTALDKYRKFTRPLTENDKVALKKIVEQDGEFADVARYMLAYNCKLEQEAIAL